MQASGPKTLTVDTQTLFQSPTHGVLSFTEVIKRVGQYINCESLDGIPSRKYHYRIIVGTDSSPRNGEHTEYITALVIHRVGLGGIYFWQKTTTPRAVTLRERIYKEAMLSIDFAKLLVESLVAANLLDLDLEIHVDVGKVGQTRDIITEVVGMVRGNGFEVKTKPESFGASKVADRHT
jgi:predicted RNase H-related nuclease YkuK (DUF458 family)